MNGKAAIELLVPKTYGSLRDDLFRAFRTGEAIHIFVPGRWDEHDWAEAARAALQERLKTKLPDLRVDGSVGVLVKHTKRTTRRSVVCVRDPGSSTPYGIVPPKATARFYRVRSPLLWRGDLVEVVKAEVFLDPAEASRFATV